MFVLLAHSPLMSSQPGIPRRTPPIRNTFFFCLVSYAGSLERDNAVAGYGLRADAVRWAVRLLQRRLQQVLHPKP